MYEEVLIATDRSDEVSIAIEEAIRLADMSDARLHALYVVDTR